LKPPRFFLVGAVILVVSMPNFCFALTPETRTLVRCESMYIYYAQYFQLQNNEGAAKNLLARATRLTAAYMLLNLEDDIVSGEKLDQFRLIRRETKGELDLDPHGNIKQLTNCDRATPAILATVRKKLIVWQGKTYEELSVYLLEASLRSLGIK